MLGILHQTTVIRDGMHNAFTDLIQWRGAYWVTYRKAHRHHYSPIGRATVAVSADRKRFEEVAHIKLPGDVRDPNLNIAPDGRLVLSLLPATREPVDGRQHQQYITFSEDGFSWDEPRAILPPGWHIYRMRPHEGTYYAMVCDREQVGEERVRRLQLAKSTDLLSWEPVCQIGPTEYHLNETDICFQPDGEAWIVARSESNPKTAYFGSAKPPYTDWELTDLGHMLHCPVILQTRGKQYVSGRCARRNEEPGTWPFGNSHAVWELTRGAVRKVLDLPAVGDCSYPGFIEDSDGRICMTYYSQHAYYMGVLPPFGARVSRDDAPYDGYAADVYFAELELE